MKLNKIFAIALCALCFTACSDDDDEPKQSVTPGFFSGKTVLVLNQGNQRSNIPGSFSSINLQNGTVDNDVFYNANGRVLGDTPQDAIVYGNKMYVGVTDSNIIDIINPTTMKSIKTIKPSGEGNSPRDLAAKDGFVYISMMNGYVARLDTLTLEIDKTIKVGPNTEEIGIAGNYLYAANSDGYNGSNNYCDGYVSKINLSTFTEEAKIQAGWNTTRLVTNGEDIFVICTGNYTTVASVLKRINSDDSVEELFPATHMSICGNKLYTINSPFYATEPPTYCLYTISDNKKTELNIENVITPIAIGIEPISGDIFIASYSSTDYSSYSQPCFVNQYNATGTFLKKYDVGVGAGCFVF